MGKQQTHRFKKYLWRCPYCARIVADHHSPVLDWYQFQHLVKPVNLRAPNYNLRQCCKELLLLEDHLLIPDAYCPECICKHMLKAEAYADEGWSLDVSWETQQELSLLATKLRQLEVAFLQGVKAQSIGHEVRALRKPVERVCFDPRPSMRELRSLGFDVEHKARIICS